MRNVGEISAIRAAAISGGIFISAIATGCLAPNGQLSFGGQAPSPQPSMSPNGLALSIQFPAPGTYINISNVSTFSMSGSCPFSGGTVTFSGSATGSANCVNNVWNTALNFSGAADGPVTITANQAGAQGPVSQSYTKDTVVP